MSKFRPAVGPKLKWLLATVFGLFALLAVNSVYLSSVTFLQWKTGETLENRFYLANFLAHLVLGFAIVVPTIVFGALHWRNVGSRPNPRAITAGIATFVSAIVLLATGVALTRVELGGVTIGVREPTTREIVYWAHVIAPFIAAWLFVLHRLSGRRIKWAVGVRWAAVAAVVAVAATLLHVVVPAAAPRVPEDGARYFEPSLAKTSTGGFIPAKGLMANEYCLECHADVVHSWAHSVHAASSFNNPFYAASVRETRAEAFKKDGHVQDARFCAGCHDPVPFFAGAFEESKWDDPAYDVANDPLGRASITCTVCHGIVSIDSPRGNADYTIQESPHYPFAFSESETLQWISNQLVKAKPSFHKRTFLKPEVHRSNEFCSTCHKVFLPEPLNDYKWLRGQDHYGSFLASGRSGHGALGWYYPEKAATSCNTCHMQAVPSEDFAARDRDGSGVRSVLSHAFPSANTALSAAVDQSACAMLPEMACEELPDGMAGESAADAHKAIVAGHAAFNAKTVRVDLFAVREGGAIDGALRVIGAELPVLDAGGRYLIEVVVRTLDIGHEFTQGTADSNEVWLWTRATLDDAGKPGKLVGISGGIDESTGELDPWSRKYNAFVIDRDGNRIDRRNPQDIFLPLYNNQIPPGAGDVTHFVLSVPEDAGAPIRLESEVRYRKFDTTYLRYVFGEKRVNDLPVMVIARDEVVLPVRGKDGRVHGAAAGAADAVPELQRWYDYGIGLFRESDRGAGRGALRQADEAFARVAELDPAIGALARARLAVREGRLDDASAALARAAEAGSKSPWTLAYFTALVDKQNGNFAKAAEGFRRVLATDFAGARERGFDFSIDVRVLNELSESLLEAALAVRNEEVRTRLAREAQQAARQSLDVDPEQAQTWWFVNRACEMLGDAESAQAARDQHARYKPDENARDRAVRLAREKYPWADAAAEATVLYSLMREGAPVGDLLPGTRVEVPGLRR
ncbi:MAG: tetratricopeptide repeat protein [Planctomycetaceae bacterium]|nr:tetratricopeptide repeat protein [Planctomycetaceae bacterium]